MNVDLQTLAIISVLTTMTTEVIKKACAVYHKEYESPIIAVIIACILSFVLIIVKPICVDGASFSLAMLYNFGVMSFFGMLASNVGFDKLRDLILAFKG